MNHLFSFEQGSVLKKKHRESFLQENQLSFVFVLLHLVPNRNAYRNYVCYDLDYV